MAVLEINFFAGSNYLLPGIKVSSKTFILGSKSWKQKDSLFATQSSSCQLYDQTKLRMVKGIDNAFDLLKFCSDFQAKAVV